MCQHLRLVTGKKAYVDVYQLHICSERKCAAFIAVSAGYRIVPR
jgi:hypothetical protein